MVFIKIMISLYACSYLSVTNNFMYEFSDDGIIAKISILRANHVSSSQSDRSKCVTCQCIKSLNAHFVSLNAHFVEHKNAKATRRALKHLDHTFGALSDIKRSGRSITVSIADNALAFGSCIIMRLDRY